MNIIYWHGFQKICSVVFNYYLKTKIWKKANQNHLQNGLVK